MEVDIYILYEHKSYKDKRIFLQLLGYMLNMWKKDFEEKNPLRVIVPLVFYHGKSKWDMPDEYVKQFKVDEEITKYLLNFKYLLFNTSEHEFDPEKIQEFKNNIALYTTLMLYKDTIKKNIKIIKKIFDFWGENDFIGGSHVFISIIHTKNPIQFIQIQKTIDDPYFNF